MNSASVHYTIPFILGSPEYRIRCPISTGLSAALLVDSFTIHGMLSSDKMGVQVLSARV